MTIAFGEMFDSARADAREWCSGRLWQWRLPLLAYLAYGGFKHLGDEYYSTIFGGITFGIHELGHVLFSWAGQWLMVAAGSLCQVAAPIAATCALLRQRDWFGGCVTVAWLAFSLWNLATYVGDARAQELPLLGLTDDPEHDWAYLLSSVSLLDADHALAFLIRGAAFLSWAASLVVGGWLLREMWRSNRP